MELFGSDLVDAVDEMSLELFGSDLVDAVDWIYRWSYLVLIWLMQLMRYRWSYLVLIWLMQLIGHIVGVICWLESFGWSFQVDAIHRWALQALQQH